MTYEFDRVHPRDVLATMEERAKGGWVLVNGTAPDLENRIILYWRRGVAP